MPDGSAAMGRFPLRLRLWALLNGYDLRPVDDALREDEWERAYDQAMRWRDWQTCEILLDEREQASWWLNRERDDDDE